MSLRAVHSRFAAVILAFAAIGGSSRPEGVLDSPQVPAKRAGVEAQRDTSGRLQIAAPQRSFRQGAVALLTITPPRPITRLEGEVFGRGIATWSASSSLVWHALVGIPLDGASGSHEVVLRAADAGGQTIDGRTTLRILHAQFATRRLRVDSRFVDPPESAAERIAREARMLTDLWSEAKGERLWRGPFRLPVPGVATSSFGRLTILNGQSRGRHQGADFHAVEGTPIHAPNAGAVVLAGDLYMSGNTIVLDHGDGLFSLLAHLSQIRVQAGARVARGEVIGDTGATGRVTGPHLHWAVRLRGTSVNPLSLVAALAKIRDSQGGQGDPRAPVIPQIVSNRSKNDRYRRNAMRRSSVDDRSPRSH